MFKQIKAVAAFAIVLASCLIFYGYFYFFRIKKIIIFGNNNLKGLSYFNGKSTLTLDEKNIIGNLLTVNPTVKTFEIKVELPYTVIINYLPREKFVYYTSDKTSGYLDNDGVYLETAEKNNLNLPQIKANGLGIYPDEKADWRITKALKYVADMNHFDLSLQEIDIDNKRNIFTLYLNSGEMAFIPQNSDPNYITPSLQVIVTRFRIDGKFIRSVDFTNDKPVVLLKSEEKNYSTP